ncbi:MAG: 5'-nucleotidase, lipoprotein e(P4) family [Candidatus Bruticola sp.]
MYKFAGKLILSLALCTVSIMPSAAKAEDTTAYLSTFLAKAPATAIKGEESKDPAARLTPLTASISWLQTSAEYKGLCYQTYNMASQAIRDKIRCGSYVNVNGKLCQEVYYRQSDGSILHIYKPLAIVLDVDETVIDNSGIEAWCLINNIPYNEELWSAWCQCQGEVPAVCREVPGAVNFLLECQKLGITPIYLTNRDESLRSATLKALINLGLNTPNLDNCLILRDKKRDKAGAKKIVEDLQISASSILGKNITANYSDKSGRRVEVRTQYEVIGWFGDNLYDMPVFVHSELDNNREILKERNEQVKMYTSKLGNTFFLLPNPIYGSWLKEQTVPPQKMLQYMDDYGFGSWYKENKNKVSGTSGR